MYKILRPFDIPVPPSPFDTDIGILTYKVLDYTLTVIYKKFCV